MEKKIKKILRLQIKAGAANPSPPVGPACGATGIKIMDFCNKFNALTKSKAGQLLPVVITVYDDKTFSFLIKNPTVSVQLMEAATLNQGSKEPNRTKVGKISLKKVISIAENKMSDFNCFTLKSALSMVAGTARSIGIEILGDNEEIN